MSQAILSPLKTWLEAGAYQGYSYSYPHKTAYRELAHPRRLRELWQNEDRSALFLYVHVPFCEMRCGFCNLFTLVGSTEDLVAAYRKKLEVQAERVRASLGEASFARLAIGGGTPTSLEAGELEELLVLVREVFGIDPHLIPASIETSPTTATRERLEVLARHGIERVSMGVQSLIEAEVRAVGRGQAKDSVLGALAELRRHDFRNLNTDLIYGLPGQDAASFRQSLATLLEFAPEEIYLYPLYVRPQTGLGKKQRTFAPDHERRELYRVGRDFLCERGYRQISMRMFQRGEIAASAGPAYCCQKDGMVGLGCGARSYTRTLHYADHFAVEQAGIKAILRSYLEKDVEELEWVRHGIELEMDEQKRRFVLQSILQVEGLDMDAFARHFGESTLEALPELGELLELGFAELVGGFLRLGAEGLELSDAIGPFLYSARVRQRMADWSPGG